MYLNIFPISHNANYRWQVFVPCFLAIDAGFLIANLVVPIVAYSLHQPIGIATFTGMLPSFIVSMFKVLMVRQR